MTNPTTPTQATPQEPPPRFACGHDGPEAAFWCDRCGFVACSECDDWRFDLAAEQNLCLPCAVTTSTTTTNINTQPTPVGATFTGQARLGFVRRVDDAAVNLSNIVVALLNHDLATTGDRADAMAALEACHALQEAHRLAFVATNILDGTATVEERRPIRESMERRAVERFAAGLS